MRSLLLSVTLAATMILVASSAPAGEFYQWTDRDGTVNLTDDVKRIPKAYQASAVKRDFADVDVAVTEMVIPAAEYDAAVKAGLERLRALNANLSLNLNRRDERCTGPVTVTSRRVDVGDYNRRLYYVTDECGRTSTVTPFSPDVQINR